MAELRGKNKKIIIWQAVQNFQNVFEMYMVYLVLHFTFYIYIWLYLRQRGKFKEEKTQIENGWTHGRERNRDRRIDRRTDRQTDKQKDRKIRMADLTNREALTVLCSVIKHAGSG